MVTPVARANGSRRLVTAEGWLRSMGIDPEFAAALGYRVHDIGLGAVRLDWPAADRMAGHRPVSAEIDVETGAIAVQRAFAHWSAPPDHRSHVIVVPDICTFLAICQVTRHESIHPFVFVVPLPGTSVPPDWSGARYWEFAGVTMLSDTLSRPAAAVQLAIAMPVANCGVATPPSRSNWRDWLLAAGRLGFAELADIKASALPIGDFAPLVDGPDGGVGSWLRRRCRSLDDEGRLCRIVRADWSSTGGSDHIVRSDRSHCAVVPARSARGVESPRGGSNWSDTSAAGYVDGIACPSSAEVGRCVMRPLARHVGDDRSARLLAAYVALTFVFPALSEIPHLLVRGGTPVSRLNFRRLLAALVHEPTVVARTRAAQMARIADAAAGVLLLDEPSPLSGPRGPTEIGSFLAASALPDASAYQSVSSRGRLSALDVFGPRIVVQSAGTGAGLACSVAVIDLPDAGDTEHLDLDGCARARDGLYAWSMANISRIAKNADDLEAGLVLPMLTRELFGEASTDDWAEAGASAETTPDTPVAGAAMTESAPAQVMEQVLEACGDGSHVAMIQLMLEIALRGCDGEAFSPERVGRWLSVHPRVDQERAPERRRLHGQISRIYPLRTNLGTSGKATDAFGFCLDTGCDGCRYAMVCPATFPELSQRKKRL